MKGIPYRETVGGLLWASLMTRPDITSAVRTVAKFCDSPGPEHWKAVVKILQYLLLTKDEGLKCGGEGPSSTMELSAMVDSDHVTCIDSRQSMSGGAVFLGGLRSRGSRGRSRLLPCRHRSRSMWRLQRW